MHINGQYWPFVFISNNKIFSDIFAKMATRNGAYVPPLAAVFWWAISNPI